MELTDDEVFSYINSKRLRNKFRAFFVKPNCNVKEIKKFTNSIDENYRNQVMRKLLLDKGLGNKTCLHTAVISDINIEVIKYLLELSFELQINIEELKDSNDETAYDIAFKYSRTNILRFLNPKYNTKNLLCLFITQNVLQNVVNYVAGDVEMITKFYNFDYFPLDGPYIHNLEEYCVYYKIDERIKQFLKHEYYSMNNKQEEIEEKDNVEKTYLEQILETNVILIETVNELSKHVKELSGQLIKLSEQVKEIKTMLE